MLSNASKLILEHFQGWGQPHREGFLPQTPESSQEGAWLPESRDHCLGKRFQDMENSPRKPQSFRAPPSPFPAHSSQIAGGFGTKDTLPKAGKELTGSVCQLRTMWNWIPGTSSALSCSIFHLLHCRIRTSPAELVSSFLPDHAPRFQHGSGGSLPQQSCHKHRFFPKRSSFIHHKPSICGPGNPESSDCTWHPSRRRGDFYPQKQIRYLPSAWNVTLGITKKKEISVLAEPGKTSAVPQSRGDTPSPCQSCTKDVPAPQPLFPQTRLGCCTLWPRTGKS